MSLKHLNRDDYVIKGRQAAREGKPPPPMHPGTWQFRAWMEGYNSHPVTSGERTPGKSVSIAIAQVAELTKHKEHWPPSAREHAHNLLLDMLRESNPERAARLMNSIQRLALRHDPRPPVPPVMGDPRKLRTAPTFVWFDETISPFIPIPKEDHEQ